jgi:hypothetical protein
MILISLITESVTLIAERITQISIRISLVSKRITLIIVIDGFFRARIDGNNANISNNLNYLYNLTSSWALGTFWMTIALIT